MSNYAHLKRQFIRELIESGGSTVEVADERLVATVPQPILKQWLKSFYSSRRMQQVPAQPRLLNHFKVGADPEFALIHESGKVVHAENWGLQAGLCFGADNNGRLVELRPKPSRFVLLVVASMLQELRWLSRSIPPASGWKAGAWTGHDGLGGHIHFGRKQEISVEAEVRALAKLCTILSASEMFSIDEIHSRQGNTSYGNPLDMRRQRHGYEYRALPSWLSSPWLSYLTLVLAKLVVFSPGLLASAPTRLSSKAARNWIRNILAMFKDLDDDARIAFLALDVWGLPRHDALSKDLRAHWGIAGLETDSEPRLLPQEISPPSQAVEELFNYLMLGRPISTMRPTEEPNWTPNRQIAGFIACQSAISTVRAPGIGEAVWDLLIPNELSFTLRYNSGSEGQPSIHLTTEMVEMMGSRFKRLCERFPRVRFTQEGSSKWCGLLIHKYYLTQERLSETRELLRCGLLPLATFSNYKSFNFQSWRLPAVKEAGRKSVLLYTG